MSHIVGAMSDTLGHRGPDDSGVWGDSGVCLGHRRLSILDLSPAGHQPMVSACGRFAIVFNGEIYNHLEIRAKLDRCSWRGGSDTETLVECFSAWGVAETLKLAVGMFAIALWDGRDRVLHLIRDRFGEKPLYFGWLGRDFAFASELKAFRVHPDFDFSNRAIDRNALASFLRFNAVPAPHSIFRDIYKLEPGCWLTVAASHAGNRPDAVPSAGYSRSGLTIRRWWSLRQTINAGRAHHFADHTEALAALDAQLRRAIRDQSMADVPLGAFLSGGVDSSLVVALMRAEAGVPVQTFTIGFEEAGYNEAGHAEAVARHLGTHHQSLYVSHRDAQAVIPLLPSLYDEPFSDSSQIPTYLVCQQARRFVTVALSGDGGDEIFGGYNRYFLSRPLWQQFSRLPGFVRKFLAMGAGNLSAKTLGALICVGGGRELDVSLMSDKVLKISELARNANSLSDFYPLLVSEWKNPNDVVVNGREYSAFDDSGGADAADWQEEERMMYLDAMTYLPNDILVKVDRAAMGVSLETRAPFLDHRIVELAWQIPLHDKIGSAKGKLPLRALLERYVPNELIDRPKQGFSVPLGDWLRGPLRDWAEHLLDEKRMLHQGFFHPEPVRAVWQQHLRHRGNWQHRLWPILMFQAWHETWLAKSA